MLCQQDTNKFLILPHETLVFIDNSILKTDSNYICVVGFILQVNPALYIAGERCTQPSLSQKQDSFPQLTVVLRTDFYFKFEGPMQGRFLNWCVIARVQSWLECEKPF